MESVFSGQDVLFGSRSPLEDLKAFRTAQASTFCASRSQVGLKILKLQFHCQVILSAPWIMLTA